MTTPRRTLLLLCILVMGAASAWLVLSVFRQPVAQELPPIPRPPAPASPVDVVAPPQARVATDDVVAGSAPMAGIPGATAPTPETITATVLIRIPWGSTDGQVGIDDPSTRGLVDGGPPIGPKSFDVDANGDVYVLDTVNARVLKYNSDGRYLQAHAVADVTADDIRVRAGFLYLFDRGSERVWHYSPTGALLATYQLPHARSYEGLYFDSSGTVLCRLRHDSGPAYVKVTDVGAPPLWLTGVLSPYDNTLLSYADPSTGRVLVHRLDGALGRTLTLQYPPLPTVFDRYFSLLGTDRQSNVYVRMMFKATSMSPWTSTLLKFSPEGTFLSSFHLSSFAPSREWFDVLPFISFRVTGDGSVYRMFVGDDATYILRFS